MRILIYVFLILISVQTSFAQTLTIRDKATGKPLEHVAVYSQAPKASAVTTAEGKAEFSKFKGATSINIDLLGYKKIIVSYAHLAAINFELLLEETTLFMDGVVVSATRWQQYKSEVPNKITTIRPADVALQNPQTAADMLDTTGEVFIQKSQAGGGSPMIRGFATNRVLLAVDGVRMNTAIFRSGNLQNVIALDPFATDRAEVVFGPGSIIYGSDAIGGVMSFYTLPARFSLNEKMSVKTNAVMRSASANFEKTGHVDVSLGWKKWASVTSATYTDFDDLTMGRHGPDEYLRTEYVKTINGRDSTVVNSDPEKQVRSGYQQLNLMQKIRFKPNESWDFNYGFHFSTTSNFPRYDRLLRLRGDNLRSAEWFYGPQIWMMNALNISNFRANQWFDNFKGVFAIQLFEESRHDRDLNDPIKSNRTEKVYVFSTNFDFEKGWSEKHHLFYGLEFLFNKVSSNGEDRNIFTGISADAPSRYPDGAIWNSYAAYLNYRFKPNEKLTLQTGLRYNFIEMRADFDRTFFPFPFNEANVSNGALTGSIGGAYKPGADWQIHTNLSTGFRAPNVDDVGKVFDSEPGSVVVPNPALKPEHAYNGELSIGKIFEDRVRLDVTGYYTFLDNALVRRNFTLNGLDSIIYDGEQSQVQAVQNAAQAKVYGLQAGIEIKLPSGFSFLSHFNLQDGEEELDDGSTASLRHAAPRFGDAHFTYSFDKFKLDFYGIYNGEISFNDLAPEERSKTYIYAEDENGNPYSPSWYTLNLKMQYQISQRLKLNMGLENITDQRYRPYSSGIAASGRNFIFSVYSNF